MLAFKKESPSAHSSLDFMISPLAHKKLTNIAGTVNDSRRLLSYIETGTPALERLHFLEPTFLIGFDFLTRKPFKIGPLPSEHSIHNPCAERGDGD